MKRQGQAQDRRLGDDFDGTADVDRAGLRHEVRGAAGRFEHAERDDERRQPPADDDQAVGRPAGQADQQADRDRQSQRQTPVHQGDPEHRPGQRQHRADRQVDAGDDQHERHSHRGDRRVGDLVGNRPECGQREEVLGGQAEDDQQHDQARRPCRDNRPGACEILFLVNSSAIRPCTSLMS